VAININELSLTVNGNVIKNNDPNGDTVLRMTQEQAEEIYADLGDFLSKNAASEKKSFQSELGSHQATVDSLAKAASDSLAKAPSSSG
jgi:hypothetical protein